MPNNLTIQIAVAGQAAAKTAFQQLGKAVQDAAKVTQEAGRQTAGAGDLISRALQAVGVESEAAERAIGPAIIAVNRFTGSFEGLRGAIAAINPELREFGEVGAAVGGLLLAKHAADATITLKNEADALGLSTEALEKYRAAATQTGGSVEGVDNFLTRFTASLGRARDAVGQLRDKQQIFNDELSTAQTRSKSTLDAAGDAVTRSYDAIDRQQTAIRSANLAATKAGEQYDQLRQATRDKFGTLNLPLGTAADDPRRLAIERLRNTQEQATIAAQRARDAQTGLAAAYRASSLAIEQERLKTQEAALEQDKLVRAQLDQERKAAGPFGKLGLDPTQFKTTEDALAAFVTKLNELGDASLRADILREVAGRGWVENQGVIKITADQLEKYRQEIVSVNDEEIKHAVDFRAAWSRMTQAIEGASLIIGDQLGSVFVPLFDGIYRLVRGNEENIRDFAKAFADVGRVAVKAFLAGFELISSVVTPVLKFVKDSFDGVAKDISKVFGFDVTGADLMVGLAALKLALPALKALFTPLITVLENVAGAFRILTGAAAATSAAISLPVIFTLAIPALIALAAYMLLAGDGWKNFKKGVEVTWDLLKAVINWIADKFVAGFAAAMILIIKAWTGAYKWVTDGIEKIVKFFDGLIDKAKKVGAAIAGAFGTKADVAPAGTPGTEYAAAGFAGGGLVHGPSGTDNVPIWATAGEGVVTKRAVDHYGPGLIHAINSLRLGARHALGGIVGSLTAGLQYQPLAFAGGGVVPAASSGHVAVDLTHNGKTFAVMAPRHVATALVQHARGEQMTRAGVMPSWKGGLVGG